VGKQPLIMHYKHWESVTSFMAGDATHIREVLHPKDGEVELPYSLAHATLEPGSASLPHMLTESDELYLIIEGHGTAYVDGQAVDLRPGAVLLIPQGAEQFVRNEGTGPLRFWCIVSPPWAADQEKVRR
jgi:mannose-6-phosphate isomerase-like protein (cupin superfamily)